MHGKGILYYHNSDQIYFNGIFDKSNYIEGIIYEPNSKKIYEGTFIKNIPKEGKNIKLYTLNGNLQYQGDLKNGQYEGKGILYKMLGNSNNYYLFYEGDFKNDNFEGTGKMFYQNKMIFYDGQFKNNMISGEGIQFYKNSNIKIKGLFENNKCVSGEYYSPNCTKLYEGSFMNGIPKESNKIIIYNNDTFKVYEGEIMNGEFEGQGIEYFPFIHDKILYEGIFSNGLYALPDLDLKISNVLKNIKIVLISIGDLPGKTCFAIRLNTNNFQSDTLATIGYDKVEKKFKYKNQDYKLIFYDTAGRERFISLALNQVSRSNMVLYFFDIIGNKGIDFSFINYIKEKNENAKIYVVGNKIDLIDKFERITEDYYERLKKLAGNAINGKKIDKFFLISVKTGEGIDKLMSSIKMDSLIYVKSCQNQIPKKPNKKKKDKCIIY